MDDSLCLGDPIVGQTLFLAPIANEIKNDIMSPETHNRMSI